MTTTGDNFRFDITSIGPTRAWLEMCMADRTATHWRTAHPTIDTPARLVFAWTTQAPSDKWTPLLAPSNADAVAVMVEQWLDSVDYPLPPDHDGHNRQGWRIFNEAWGHVDGQWEAFLAVEPCWQTYGK